VAQDPEIRKRIGVIQVAKTEYHRWHNAYRISNGTVDLIVLADVGPRVMHYGYCGRENQFHEFGGEAGLTGGNDFRLYGGHRLWAWPELERTYYPDNVPVAVVQTSDGVLFRAPIETAHPGTLLQREMRITLDTSGSHVTVHHRISNHGSAETELAVWAPTVMKPGGRAILPFPPRAAMDKDHFQSVGPLTLWSFTDFADPRWRLGTEYLQLIQSENRSGRFPEQMTGLFVPDCWGAYFHAGTVMLKRTKLVAGATYPDRGCNYEVFTNAEFLELETLGPVSTLEPGESSEHIEHWWLFSGVESLSDDESIRSAILPLVQQTAGY